MAIGCRTRRVLLTALIGSLAVVAAAPHTAAAGTVIGSGARLAYVDVDSINPSGTHEQNSLSVTFEAGYYVFTDAGAVITTGLNATDRCQYTTSSHTVKCSSAPGDVIQVDTGPLDDQVDVSVGAEVFVCGGEGDDALTATGSSVANLVGGSGNDILVGDDGFNAFTGDDHCILDEGNPGADVMVGKGGDDVFLSGDGNDRVHAGAGADTVFGDAGDDSLLGEAGEDLLVGGDGRDELFGGEDADALAGAAGDDRIFGEAGNDTLGVTFALSESVIARESGDDYMLGGDGDDVLNGGPGEFVLNRGALFHPVESEQESAPNGRDTLLGGSGKDTVTYVGRKPAVAVTIDSTANDGSPGEQDDVGQDVEVVNGGSGDDVLRAGALGMSLDGGEGDDLLVGGRRDDVLTGGVDDEGADSLFGGNGKDKLSGGGAEDSLRGEGGDDRIEGGSGSDYIDGGDGADELRGDRGADIMRSRGSGADKDRCGLGLDLAIVQPRTSVSRDCERIDGRGSGASQRTTHFALRPLAGDPVFSPSLMFNSAPLIDTVRLPFDSEVDLGTRGSVAIGEPRRVSKGATVTGGAFAGLQGRGRTVIELRLLRRGAACSQGRPRLRLNARRRFAVIGKRSKSIGRRAMWVTEERCGGTLTRVRRGHVVVTDLGRGRRVTVRAGRSYLARDR